MTTSTPIVELDFDEIKANLKAYLQSQSRFVDYDFDGSNMAAILDVLAYNTFMGSFYNNMAHAEMFLDTAQLPSSVVSHAKHLNYLPRSYRSAQAEVTIEFATANGSYVTIPKYTKFTSTIDGVSYTFSTDEVYTVVDNDGIFQKTDVVIYEGRIEKEYYNVVSSATKFVISNDQVDTNSIVVRVYESNSPTAAFSEYTLKSNLFGVGSTDEVFYIQPSDNHKYEVTFGAGVFGVQPSVGQVVEIIYRIAAGESPNGARAFTSVGTIGGFTPTVTTESNASGGNSRESLSSIKFNAPKAIQIQDRAVVESDYEILLQNNFSEIQAVSVYGGENLDPPRFGRVIVAVDVANSDGVSENDKAKYQSFLKDRSPLSIEPIVISPKFMYTEVISEVKYNTKISSKSSDEIKSLVLSAITSFSDTILNGFKKNMRHSRLTRAIDDSDTAIVGNDTTTRMVVDLTPELNTSTSYTIQFNNGLNKEVLFDTSDEITSADPAITSSNFTYQGTTCYIQDNSDGVLQIITTAGTTTDETFKILLADAGSVNYDNGTTTIRNLNVSAFTGQAIKLYARGKSQDIIGPYDRILSIRPEDVVVTATAAEQ